MDAPSQGVQDATDGHEYRLQHWLSETAFNTRLMKDVRADSPVLGFDHTLHHVHRSEKVFITCSHCAELTHTLYSLYQSCPHRCLVSLLHLHHLLSPSAVGLTVMLSTSMQKKSATGWTSGLFQVILNLSMNNNNNSKRAAMALVLEESITLRILKEM